MSQKDDLNDFKEIKLNLQEKFKEIIGEEKEFPKYTTQIMNIANQNAQGTRSEVVGQMSELIQKCPEKNYTNKRNEKWRLANVYEESQNIDGYIGEIPVSIKPITYLAKKSSVRETIHVEMIYYKKTDKYLYIYTKL